MPSLPLLNCNVNPFIVDYNKPATVVCNQYVKAPRRSPVALKGFNQVADNYY